MAIRWTVNSVLVAALVVVFAGWGPFAAEKISEEQAIAEIQKLGGEVQINKWHPSRPVAVSSEAPMSRTPGWNTSKG